MFEAYLKMLDDLTAALRRLIIEVQPYDLELCAHLNRILIDICNYQDKLLQAGQQDPDVGRPWPDIHPPFADFYKGVREDLKETLDGTGLDYRLNELELEQHIPKNSESESSGSPIGPITRGSDRFRRLIRNENPKIEFKDEEGTGADRMMTRNLGVRLEILAELVAVEWPGVKLRITEAWDENGEHRGKMHYEARAADMTTSPIDANKLGRLAQLAVYAGFNWVFYENKLHVHASVFKDE